MNHEFTKRAIVDAYRLIEAKPKDRLDYLSKALQIRMVLNGAMTFLVEVASAQNVDAFTKEDLSFIHESFCVSAIPLVHMIEHFLEKSIEEEARETFLAV